MAFSNSQLVRCEMCKAPLQLRSVVMSEKFYHPQCFKCLQCKQLLVTEYNEFGGDPFCQKCYFEKWDETKCYGCQKSSCGESIVRILGREYHVACANCYGCKKNLTGAESNSVCKFENEPYCLQCSSTRLMKASGGLKVKE